MNDLRQAAEMALKALESWQKTCLDCGRASEELGRATKPIQPLRQALAEQPVKQATWALAQEIIGCFDAAELEGLSIALAETTDERLRDLVERRLMYARYAAIDALRQALAQQKKSDSIRPKGKSIVKVWVDEINQAQDCSAKIRARGE